MSLYTYIDLYEHGNKIKNIGYVKSEIVSTSWKVKVFIRNLPETDTLMCEMKTMNSEKYLDRFEIIRGKGYYAKQYDVEQLKEKGIQLQEVQGLLFQIASHKYGKCIWEKKDSIEMKAAEKAIENITEKCLPEECEKNTDEPSVIEGNVELPEYKMHHIDIDKWKQLGRMYATVHPFREKEKGEYISISPKDFVILQEKYQVLVNNSFLLHGYFNYRHILLGKIKEENKWKYYIGVPGTFYEREKIVAIMFGFERFVGVDTEEQGAFGYYMKEVQI